MHTAAGAWARLAAVRTRQPAFLIGDSSTKPLAMTTRRSFIKTLAAIAPVACARRSWAASADPTRVAMVIGNGAYRSAPLPNPVNDARAMAALFGQAGFTVDSQLDAARGDLVAAIERLGMAARRPETRQVVFYYAGHGVQLDWRNYLLPVDA